MHVKINRECRDSYWNQLFHFTIFPTQRHCRGDWNEPYQSEAVGKEKSPVHDGAVLPILHLNGYKIANPTLLSRISKQELESFFLGHGYRPIFVEGSKPEEMHQKMARALDEIFEDIQAIQDQARTSGFSKRPKWPLLVLRTPKGWTGPKKIDGKKVEDFWRSHQVPISNLHEHPQGISLLEKWMKYPGSGPFLP